MISKSWIVWVGKEDGEGRVEEAFQELARAWNIDGKMEWNRVESWAQVQQSEVGIAILPVAEVPRNLAATLGILAIFPFEDPKASASENPILLWTAVVGNRENEAVAAAWKVLDRRKTWGKVSLVGAGPGDPELLTLKAARLLSEADIVFNDSLANPAILDGLKAQIHFVGKRKDFHGLKQLEINELLFRAAVDGKKVVRLKGGDPMLFGRATEEMRYLEERLVEIEIVPGISSAFAASSYTEIPLTEREVAATVAFCLGYPEEKIQAPLVDTAVYFMGSTTLSTIVEKNLLAGRPETTPVALISNASLEIQEVVLTTLGELKKRHEAGEPLTYPTPLLIFIGKVVDLDKKTNWYHRSLEKK